MRTYYSLIKTIFTSSFSFRFHPTLIILFSLSLAIFYISPGAQADTILAAQAANSIFTGTFYCKTIAFLDVESAAACEVTNAPQRDCAYHVSKWGQKKNNLRNMSALWANERKNKFTLTLYYFGLFIVNYLNLIDFH